MSDKYVFSIEALPVPALLCDLRGDILDCNRKATSLIGKDITSCNIDSLMDFSHADLPECNRFSQAAEILRSRNSKHNVIRIEFDVPPVSYLNLFFNFYTQNEAELVLIELHDVSDQVKLVDAFEYKQNILDNIVITSTDALIVFDDYGGIELFSPAAESLFGKTSTEMIIEDIYSLFSDESRAKIESIINHLNSIDDNNEIMVFENLEPMNVLGKTFPASITFSKSQKDDNALYFMVITDKSLFQKFVNSVNDAYIKIDSQGNIIDINNKAEELFGCNRNALISQHISFLGIRNSSSSIVLSDIADIEKSNNDDDYVAVCCEGKELTLNLTVWPQDVNNIRLNNLIVRDVSHKKLAEKQLITTAFTDSLTSLDNRASFNKKLNEQLDNACENGKAFSLIAIDLDKFKYVNDSFGHDYGDELLKIVSRRLSACVREEDTVSRIGGDEFTIIVKKPESQSSLNKIADRILRTLRREYQLKDKKVTISCSIGIAFYPEDADNSEDLYKAADMAMYAAKRSGKDAFRRFTKEMFHEYERIKLIERELKTAVEKGELSLHFQPKISYSNSCLVGFEALLRWNSSILGNVSPVEFIPIAEDSKCICDITRWVLREAIRCMKQWYATTTVAQSNRITVAINISAEHFKQDIYSDITQIVEEEKFDPTLLELEITESTLLESSQEVVDELRRLRDFGVKISMDDFGTGYSSLQYLKHFALDTLKIDRSFVRDISTDDHNILIIESIISIAKRLDLNLVAEGVESAMDVEKLVSMGCDIFQGYYYSKPIPKVDVENYLKQCKVSIPGLHQELFKVKLGPAI